MKYAPHMLRFYNNDVDVDSGVVLGETTESIYLDFKKDLDRAGSKTEEEKRKGQLEFCRDLAQFANTLGGAILIGIEEMASNGTKVAKSIVPLDDFDSRRQWMEQAVTNYLVPSTVPFRIEPIRMPQGLIIAVNVPASERLLSLWDRKLHTIEYVRRTNHGKEWMNPDEAEAHMADTGRRAKLALQRLHNDERFPRSLLVDLVSGVWEYSVKPGLATRIPSRASLMYLDEYDFKLSIEGVQQIAIPYGLLREAWRTTEGEREFAPPWHNKRD